MQNSQIKFHSVNGKRRILIVEDEVINREILRMMLEDSYELIYAETGTEAIRAVSDHSETLSLILLDLLLGFKESRSAWYALCLQRWGDGQTDCLI